MILDVLNESRIVSNERFEDWRDCIRKCGELLINSGDITEAYVDSMIETLQKFGPYMIILPEIALFHGKPGTGVNQDCLSIVVLREELTFKDFNDEKIKCAIAFGAKTNDSHIGILQELAYVLQDTEFVELLRNNGNATEILKRLNSLIKEKK